MSDGSEWLLWASRFNQLSLLPFLAFLWTLWHIPNAPTRAVHGFTFYLVFIAVGIPAGIYCRQQLGTSMANVDWIHGELVVTAPSTIAMLLYSSSELANTNCSSNHSAVMQYMKPCHFVSNISVVSFLVGSTAVCYGRVWVRYWDIC